MDYEIRLPALFTMFGVTGGLECYYPTSDGALELAMDDGSTYVEIGVLLADG